MKTFSVFWSFVVGVTFVTFQLIIFYVRFGRLPQSSPWTDYLLFFIAGTLGGLILIYFLNQARQARARRSILLAFLLALPFALLLSVLGGLLGWWGVIVYPLFFWALFTWIGSLVGRTA